MAQGNFSTEIVIVYNKVNGKIVLACSLLPHFMNRQQEENIKKLLPGIDVSNFDMVIVRGKQYLQVNCFKVIVGTNGEFVEIIKI